MRILLIFDQGFQIDSAKLLDVLNQKLKRIKIEIYNTSLSIEDPEISRGTFDKLETLLEDELGSGDATLCFTHKQYEDNFFYYEYGNLTIISLYDWEYLTTLPIANGVIYFICSYLASIVDTRGFSHKKLTGCINDSLSDKTGIDNAMRVAMFCPDCLRKVKSKVVQKVRREIFMDLKSLMNVLSGASKWEEDVLNVIKTNSRIVKKRKAKSKGEVKITIASPGDTSIERKLLLNSLESEFRKHDYEKICGHRIVVTGWEELASQMGHPQDVINEKIIENSDFLVAIFKHKLGTPVKNPQTGTMRSSSGTSEELWHALDKTNDSHPIAMVYYYKKAPTLSLDAMDKNIIKEWKRLTEFKKSIQDKILYKEYKKPAELLSIVLRDLEKNITDYIEK